jgi:hypothetical protein
MQKYATCNYGMGHENKHKCTRHTVFGYGFYHVFDLGLPHLILLCSSRLRSHCLLCFSRRRGCSNALLLSSRCPPVLLRARRRWRADVLANAREERIGVAILALRRAIRGFKRLERHLNRQANAIRTDPQCRRVCSSTLAVVAVQPTDKREEEVVGMAQHNVQRPPPVRMIVARGDHVPITRQPTGWDVHRCRSHQRRRVVDGRHERRQPPHLELLLVCLDVRREDHLLRRTRQLGVLNLQLQGVVRRINQRHILRGHATREQRRSCHP